VKVLSALVRDLGRVTVTPEVDEASFSIVVVLSADAAQLNSAFVQLVLEPVFEQ